MLRSLTPLIGAPALIACVMSPAIRLLDRRDWKRQARAAQVVNDARSKAAHAHYARVRAAEMKAICADATDAMICLGLSAPDRHYAHELISQGSSLDEAIAAALAMPGEVSARRGGWI